MLMKTMQGNMGPERSFPKGTHSPYIA